MKRNRFFSIHILVFVLATGLCWAGAVPARATLRKQVRAKVAVIASCNIEAGGGAYPMAVVASMKMFQYAGAKPVLIDMEDIDKGRLGQFDVIYFAGGYADHYYRYYQGSIAQKIRDFIADGGGYIGVCAGAYFACDKIQWENGVYDYPLNLNPGQASGGLKGVGSIHDLANGANYDPWALCNIRITHKESGDSYDVGQSFKVGYLYGPYFENLGSATVVARYDYNGSADEKPAMVKYSYGNGKVFLSGPHPEFEETATIDASRDWAFGDNYGNANKDGIPVNDPDSEWDLMRDVLAWMCPDKVVWEDVPDRTPKTRRAAVYAGPGTSARVVWPVMKMLDELGIEPYAWDGYGSYEVVKREWVAPHSPRFQLCVFPNGNTALMRTKYQGTNDMIFIQKATMKKFLQDGGHIIGIGGGARAVLDSQTLGFWESSTYTPESPVNHGMEGITLIDDTIKGDGQDDYQVAYWSKPAAADGWDEGQIASNTIFAGQYTPVAWRSGQVTQQQGAVAVAYFDDLGQDKIAMVRYPKWNGKIFLCAVDPFVEEGSLKDDCLWDNRSSQEASDGYNDPDSEKTIIRNVLSWMGLVPEQTSRKVRTETFGTMVAAGSQDANHYHYIDATDTSRDIELKLEWENTQADLDLFLFDPSGNLVAASSSNNRNPERVSFRPHVSGRYKIKVQAYSNLSFYVLKATYKVGSVTRILDLDDAYFARSFLLPVGNGTGTINIEVERAGDQTFDILLLGPDKVPVKDIQKTGLNGLWHISYTVSGKGGNYIFTISAADDQRGRISAVWPQ